MNSVWTENINRISFPALSGSISTDVLIVGGGMAGVLSAYMLRKAGVDCVLVEAKKTGEGITKNTTAKITCQHGLIYDKLIKKYGTEKAGLYLEAQKKACNEIAALCEKIDCDYEVRDSFVYSLCDREKIEDEVNALKKLGENAEFFRETPLPFDVAGAVSVKNQAQFHPMKFLISISRGLPIYENTKVIHLMPYKAVTSHGEISFKKIIIATHFPVLNKHGWYPLKMFQHRSYVIALENAQNVNGMFVDEDEKGMSFRSYKNLLLLGGGDHRTGKKGGNWRELEEFALKHYPDANIRYKWATQDCMTLDSVPYIGQYSKHTPDTFVATGFNKWGMSSSMAAAMLLRDLVTGKNNPYASVFNPSRSILHPQLFVNFFENSVGFFTPTTPRCPHLGCALKYNPDEHSWDCTCHGSRFTEDGELIDNPATDDMR